MRTTLPPLLIYGTGGHAKVVADISKRGKVVSTLAGFVDDTRTGSLDEKHDLALPADGLAVSIGKDPCVRYRAYSHCRR